MIVETMFTSFIATDIIKIDNYTLESYCREQINISNKDSQSDHLNLASKQLMPECFNEFSSYTYKMAANGNVSFTHPQGLHDDIVDSVMMANLSRNKHAFIKSKLYIGNPNKNQYERI